MYTLLFCLCVSDYILQLHNLNGLEQNTLPVLRMFIFRRLVGIQKYRSHSYLNGDGIKNPSLEKVVRKYQHKSWLLVKLHPGPLYIETFPKYRYGVNLFFMFFFIIIIIIIYNIYTAHYLIKNYFKRFTI